MNRSILIVICDFLLVSLLLFSTPDLSKVTEEGVETPARIEMATNQPSGGADLAAVMRTALTEEQAKREQLVGELERTRQSAAQRQVLLNEREKQFSTVQQQLEQSQQQQAALEQQYAAAQTNVQALGQQLHARSTEAIISNEKLAAMQSDLQQQLDQTAALKQRLAEVERTNQMVLAEKQKLAGQLQLAEVEKRHATELATQMQQQVQVERQEKAQLVQQATQLAEGVKVLAAKSGELAQEVRETRPLAPNTIFNVFLTNRVQARFDGVRPGLFGGETTQRRAVQTVLVSDGTNTFALCHVQDTPLTLGNPGTDWEGLTATLTHDSAHVAVHSLSFCWPDPRVLLIPVSATDARQLGCKVYQESSDPFKFQDAVLIGSQESYYGECRFQIDSNTPGYVKLDRSFLKGLIGQFNPSRGDLVFSRTGEFLGIMANDTYCMMVRKFDAAATLRLGQDVRTQHTGDTLSRLYAFVTGLPTELQ